MSKVELKNYIPGAIGRISQLHGEYYHKHWGFGLFFEAKVASEMSEFLTRYDEGTDLYLTACLNGKIEGGVTIDGEGPDSEEAHLRWFIISSALRGHGVGARLIEKAVEFCRQKQFKRIYLWTFEGLHPARHLYEKNGFRLDRELLGKQWGVEVKEQKFVLEL